LVDVVGGGSKRQCRQPLGGGITNTNFTVSNRGRKYVVRIGGDIPIHQISRANELAASRAAHAAGISPAVVHAEPLGARLPDAMLRA